MTQNSEKVSNSKEKEDADTDPSSSDPEESRGNSTLIKKLKNAEYRSKFLQSMWIAGSLFALIATVIPFSYIILKAIPTIYRHRSKFNKGVTSSQGGSTFLDLQIITSSNVEKTSVFFTAGSIGRLVGVLISGPVFSKVEQNLAVFLCLILLASSTVATPYSSIYGLMIMVKLVAGVCIGFINAGGNVKHLKIWGDDGRALMQFLHFVCALGNVLAPLLTEPFLTPRSSTSHNSSHRAFPEMNSPRTDLNFTETGMPVHTTQIFTDVSTNINANSSSDAHIDGTLSTATNLRIQYAFWITGSLTILTSIPFLVTFIQGRSVKQKGGTSQTEKTLHRKLPLSVQGFIIFSICIFFLAYCAVEEIFASFLMAFLVREFDFISKSQGAYMIAIFWTSFATSRFLMIFVSKFLVPTQLIILCVTVTLMSSIGFTISATYGSTTFMTIFAALAGLGMSATFPGFLSWSTSELMLINHFVSPFIFVSFSIGGMVFPIIVSTLMDKEANMWFCYMHNIAISTLIFVFLLMLFSNRLILNKRYGPLYLPRKRHLVREKIGDQSDQAV